MRRSRACFRAAALLAVLFALSSTSNAAADGASLDRATAAQKRTASQTYAAGMQSYKAGDIAKAQEDFQRSYDAVASPNSHLMLARCLMQAGHLFDAQSHLEQTLDESRQAQRTAKKYAETADAASNELAELRTRFGRVQVEVLGADESDTLRVADATIERKDWSEAVIVEPGEVSVALVGGDGTEKKRAVVQVGQGGSVAVRLDVRPEAPPTPAPVALPTPRPQPPPPPKSHHVPTVSYITGGVGLAGVATFALFGVMSNSKYSKLESRCSTNVCDPSLAGERDQGRDFQTIANMGLITGAVGLTTALVVYLVDGQEPSAPTGAPRASIGIGPRYLGVSGSFR